MPAAWRTTVRLRFDSGARFLRNSCEGKELPKSAMIYARPRAPYGAIHPARVNVSELSAVLICGARR